MFEQPHGILPELVGLIHVDPTFVRIVVKRVGKLGGKTVTIIRIHPGARQHGHKNVENILAIGDGKDIRRVGTCEGRLAHIVHLLFGDAIAGQVGAVYFGLDLQGAVLHLEHERHDFRVGGLG